MDNVLKITTQGVMLKIFTAALDELFRDRTGPISSSDRIQIFLASGIAAFTRKDYLNHFKTISTATASRDLSFAVKE